MGDVLVNLAEVLEVRDSALSEDEIVALFVRAIGPLQTLASEAKASHAFDCGFSPETFFLHVDGSVEVKPLHKDGVAAEFLPPEMIDSGEKQNDIAQAYVYCLGAVLGFALRYPNEESDTDDSAMSASPELLSLLNVMTVRDISTRPTLTRLAQMGRQRVLERKIDPVKLVIDLHHSVMGDDEQVDFSDDDDPISGEYSLEADEAPARRASAVVSSGPVDAMQPVRRESAADDTLSSNRASTPSATVIGLDIDISEIGSPIGNSTELPAVHPNDSLVVHAPDRDSWVSFDAPKLSDSTGVRKESMMSSSGDEEVESKKPTLDPFAYDRLQESLTASGRDPFSSDSNKTTPRRPAPLDGIMPQRRSVDLSSSKDHTCVGGARSCHSLECQFCSPTHPQFGAKTATAANGSLPALLLLDEAASDEPVAAVREKKRKLLATPENLLLGAKANGGRDPFASFEDLAHPDSSVNNRPPVSRFSSTASSSSASSSRSRESAAIPAAGEIRVLQKGGQGADEISSSADPEEPEMPEAVAARSAFPIDAKVVIEQPSRRALDEKEQAATKPTPAPRKTLPAVVERSSSASSVDSVDHFVEDTSASLTARLPPDEPASRREQDQRTNGSTPFARRNSLASNRISGRTPSTRRATTASRKVSGMGGPEFLYKSRMPSIRLKAPPTRKRNNPLVRTDSSGVQVVLLSGQRVEVTCRTDAIASEIFDLVVAHTNLNEHYFFGLTVLKDGEHFFLEPHQRLSKFAPPGWKNQRKTQARNIFTLFLRLKYYPHSLEFIKTELTLHEMYLQLRRDVIDERMHANRDAAYQLAALALQAELGDRPSESTNYFHPNHYLPDRHLREEMGGDERIRSLLAELHSQYSGMSPREAETELLKMCQAEREYGIHFHRVFRSKPSLNLGNTPLGDPETGTALWIGIMPRGIVVFEERSGTRVATSQHPWHETQTLQFDKKRFIIVGIQPKDGGEPKKTIFFTDDYKKSSYFVKFAAVQHRFMIKMRQWTLTLQSDATKTRDMTADLTAGVSVDRHINNLSTYSGKSSTDSGVPDLSREASPEEKLATSSRTNKAKPLPVPQLIGEKPGVLNVSVPSTDRTLTELNNNDSISASFAARLDDARPSSTDGTEFDVTLSKDPQFGLGLTLVDGDLNGIKGVYVKSVTSGGPGDLQGGLRIGDRLLSVNGVSLRGKNRHDTVTLVKQSDGSVRMTVLRLRGLSSSAESLSSGPKPTHPPPALPQSTSKRVNDLRTAASATRQRAVSDFGAAGDTLPTLKSEDIIADYQMRRRSNSMEKQRGSNSSNLLDARQLTPAKSDGHLTTAVNLRSNDRPTAPSTNSNRSSTASTESSRSSGEYQMPKDALAGRNGSPHMPSTIYGGFDPSDDSDAEAPSVRAEQVSAARFSRTRSSSEDDVDDDESFGKVKRPTNVEARRRDDSFTMNQLDWTDHIDIGDVSTIDNNLIHDDDDEEWQEFDVTLSKNERGGLGLQIAGGSQGKNRIYVKALVATPALTCDEIRPGDRLVSVNRILTEGKSHQQVVDLLKTATSPVTLGLARPLTHTESDSESDNVDGMETLSVTLEKPASGSLGLSLAKLTGGVGIYVRVIAVGSVADLNGHLRVGDRLWEVNGESVADASPLEVVEKLKKAEGFVNLVFKRSKESVVS